MGYQIISMVIIRDKRTQLGILQIPAFLPVGLKLRMSSMESIWGLDSRITSFLRSAKNLLQSFDHAQECSFRGIGYVREHCILKVEID